MAPQASKKCDLLPPDHQQIGCCTSNSFDSEQASGAFSRLMISSLSPQASTQSEKRLLAPFSSGAFCRDLEGTQVTKRLGLSLRVSQALGILWLAVAMFFFPTERWTTLPTSDALAADSQLAPGLGDWDNVYNPCFFAIKSTETLYRPHGPIPDPSPLVIGCKLADCGPGTDGPGPIDLRITLTGDLAERAILEFENMTVQEAASIGVRGNARHVKGTTRFEVRSGITVLRGFGTNPTLRPPVATPHLTLNSKALEALKQAAKGDDLIANSKSRVTLVIDQFRGRVNVNGYGVRYDFEVCPLPDPPLPPAEADRVEFSRGIPPDKVLVLAPGRLGSGPWGCAGYEDEVYESSAQAAVPITNHLEDEGSIILLRDGGERYIWSLCHSEVVVYSRSSALAVVKPVTPPWTNLVGNTLPVALQNPLEVPVTIWVLLDDPNKIIDQRLKKEILEDANRIFKDAMCGITFDIVTVHSVNTDIKLPANLRHDYVWIADVAAYGEVRMKEGCIYPKSGKPCLYDPTSLNVYLVEYIGGDKGFTSYSPTFGSCPRTNIPTCDFFGNMIFLVESRGYDTPAHEFAHTLELDGTDGISGFSKMNLMTESMRGGDSITKGQCYRTNVDHFSYVNTGGIRPSPSPTHGNCPRDGAPSNVCPELGFDHP